MIPRVPRGRGHEHQDALLWASIWLMAWIRTVSEAAADDAEEQADAKEDELEDKADAKEEELRDDG